MANSETMTLQSFMDQAMEKSAAARAAMQYKQAAAPTATDPTCQGEVSIPSAGDGANRSALNLPENRCNCGDATSKQKMHNLLNVTKPDGVGQGSYITPQNGTAQNDAVTSFTAPLDKLAEASRDLFNAAQSDVPMQTADLTDVDLMRKLASIGHAMMGSEEGQRAVATMLEKEAGMQEAQNIINETSTMLYNDAMQKSAAAAEFEKYASACQLTHAHWLSQLQTDLEKVAYMQGAADGQQAAEAAAAGQDPTAAGDEGISEEEVAQTLQQMVQQGIINEEQLQALMQEAAPMAQDGLTEEEMAQLLQQAMQSGEIDQQQAQQIAEMWLQQNGGGEAGAPGPEEMGAPGPEAMGADPEAVKAASVLAGAAGNMIDHLIQFG